MTAHKYLSKDFIETNEGLAFAVVQTGTEQSHGHSKVLCFLRYIRQDAVQDKSWHKMNTKDANCYLLDNFPEYIHYSAILDAHLHAVPVNCIARHHRPRQRLQTILSGRQHDEVEQNLYDLCDLFQQYGLDLKKVGVTGSLLIGAQQTTSDIDLVIYDREVFHKARAILAESINKSQLGELNDSDWLDAYQRRSSTLIFTEYVWHERRKFNKALINGRKFDLSYIDEQVDSEPVIYQKCGEIILQAKVIEDHYSFDYPAIFRIDHDTTETVVCFTATYTGQALIGEIIEVSGLLEQAENGSKRIVVGSSREAPGEYIKVINASLN